MLCIISYDLHGDEKDYQPLYDKMEALGATYRCSESTVLLHTGIDAGLVDSAIRSVVDDEATFIVVDITGIDEEKYFGRVPSRAKGDGFWKWLKEHNN